MSDPAALRAPPSGGAAGHRGAAAATMGNQAMLRRSSIAAAILQRQPAAPAAAGPFASETADMKTRRLDAIAAARTSIARLGKGMQSGYLWAGEVVTAQGEITLPATHPHVRETKAARDTRLQSLRADLVAIIQTLESGPIPPAWLAPQATFPATATKSASSMMSVATSQSFVDVTMFYAIRASELGRDSDVVFVNWDYIDTDPIPKKAVKPKAINNGIELGTQIVVEDPENKPLEARLAGKNDGTTKETQLYALWKDDLGYFYIYNSERHYLKGRPNHY